MTNPYEVGFRFAKLFGRTEHALKRTGFLQKKPVAEADWKAFAAKLDPNFFHQVVASRVATTLINKPPRKLMADGLNWAPEKPDPLASNEALIVQGVCRVRNSFFHGEKFTGGPDYAQRERDVTLVVEAHAVLEMAGSAIPEVAALLKSPQAVAHE